MKLKRIIAMLLCLCMIVSMTACDKKKEEEPINLTMWHVYGEMVSSPLNELISEFNSTVGKEQGIYVSVTAVSNSNKIHEGILAAVGNEPGAPELPDIFNSYPKTIDAMKDSDILVDYHDYFSDDRLKDYIPEFVDEGTFDGELKIFPVAKSTELMFVNKTLFDRFSAATGATLEDLSTWEGLFKTSVLYYEYTDALTPDIPGDGKAMFVNDYPFHYFQVGVRQLGGEFFDGEKLSFSPEYKTVWEPLALATMKGGMWLADEYATASLRTGDAIVSMASSASVLYYENLVTYEDNTSEPVEFIAVAPPVFEGGEKLIMQRGTGLCTIKSTPEREKAACTFIQWLTAPEQNARFTASLGYVSVCHDAYGDVLTKEIDGLTDTKYKSLYQTIQELPNEFTYIYVPNFEGYLDIETKFIEVVIKTLEDMQKDYRIRIQNGEDPEETARTLSDEYYTRLQNALS